MLSNDTARIAMVTCSRMRWMIMHSEQESAALFQRSVGTTEENTYEQRQSAHAVWHSRLDALPLDLT
jgi:hypothetical protein